jgi:HPt (histidine-containing phosphotransfer) domain-containing protein
MARASAASKQQALTQLDARQQEFLGKTRDAAEYVLTFADDMLDYLRIESGKLELQQIVFDPGEAAQTVVHLYQERAQSRQIQLSARLFGSLPAQVKGDPVRLRQVIGSLVGNAIKFSQGGEIAIEVSAGPRTGNRVQLLVKIKDSGIGIAEEARMRIYQTFVHGDEKLGIPTGSASLGLSIARQLVRRMGGELQLDGTVEQSTGFRFTVDVEEVEGPRTQDMPVAAAREERSTEGEPVRQSLGFAVPSTTPGQWEQVIEVYLDSARELIERLTNAIEGDEVEQACSVARTLGGCSAKIGAPDLAALCRKIEDTVQGNDFPGARSQLHELVMTYEQAKISLRRVGIAPEGPSPGGPRDSIPAVA